MVEFGSIGDGARLPGNSKDREEQATRAQDFERIVEE